MSKVDKLHRFFIYVGLSIVVGLATGCSSNPQFGAAVSELLTVDSYDIRVKLTVSQDVNPDPNGRPSPVVLQIFQLTNDSKFQQANLADLLDNHEAMLAAELIKMDRTLASPANNLTYELTVNADTKYLGVLAAFQKEDGIAKRVIDIEGGWSKDICIELAKTSIAAATRC
ncbi:type VI secretion system lipoprotein TssJ [Ningiella sp. W23]|uniref:type VI secretion system lipoprotein TssJ n=1 Tax=Ningiella sp. W23 TaxID=3023715 RepID=UPI00375713C9